MTREPAILQQSEPDDRAQHHMVTMRDGVKLATDVYLPSPTTSPAPTVLIRLPYDKTGRYTFIPQVGEHFAAHGFVCVAQDVRGKYRSEGERNPFAHEADDGWDTIEWIIDQEWSNGLVGTWGDSYYGFTQWALASRTHPAHRAMVPRVTGHRFGDMRPAGGLPTFTLLDWVIDAWALPELILANGASHERLPAKDAAHPSLPHGHDLLQRFIAVSKDPDSFVDSIFPAGDPAAQLTIPALHTGGWFDNLQFWQLDDWAAALESPAAEHQFLRMWTSDHEDYRWRESAVGLTNDFGSDGDALANHIPDLLAEAISFLRHYLGGGEGRWPQPKIRYEHARVGLRSAAEWPPKRVQPVTLHLAPGALSPDPAGSAADVVWVHDPADPVPFPIPSEWGQNRPGLPDEQALHERDDVVTFTTEELDRHLDLAGRVTFTGRISAQTERTHVIARLLDVAPNGEARLICANASDVVADSVSPFAIRMGDTAYRLPSGHRLRLAISSSLHGQYPVHPGTDADPWEAIEHRRSPQVLHLQGATLNFTEDRG